MEVAKLLRSLNGTSFQIDEATAVQFEITNDQARLIIKQTKKVDVSAYNWFTPYGPGWKNGWRNSYSRANW